MKNLDKYIKIRNEFGEKLKDKAYKAELAAWNFYTNSTQENLAKFTQAQEDVSDLYKDKQTYEELKKIQKIGLNEKHSDKQLRDLIKNFYEEIDSGKELKILRDKESEISQKYNSYTMTIDGKKISKAEITKILETEKDPQLRKKAYDANVKAGDVIANDLKELIILRNKFAKQKGYSNYYNYMLETAYDIKGEELEQILNKVYTKIGLKCREFYRFNQNELAKSFGTDIENLYDYHYGLLGENNPEKKVNSYLKTKELIIDTAKQTYKQMGFDVNNMGITLDLFPRENKNTHGFAFCIKPGQDARILANLTNNVKSLDTLLHELGHCVYDIGIDTRLPFLDQDSSSAVMTEAIAMMMGDLVKAEGILSGIVPETDLKPFMAKLKEDDAKFVTRCLQIINFESEMYKNPNQDLKLLWKQMKEKFLYRNSNTEINNEWATIPHYLSHPAYYQNYFRAGLLKVQIYNSMKIELGDITKNSKSAGFLNNRLFKYGCSIYEPELIQNITGKPLSEEDFCNRIV